MVEKEVFLYFIVYNLIRLLMQEASATNASVSVGVFDFVGLGFSG
jgi:hypothetical protein